MPFACINFELTAECVSVWCVCVCVGVSVWWDVLLLIATRYKLLGHCDAHMVMVVSCMRLLCTMKLCYNI